MSNYEINNLDPNDIGLKQVMGNRFHDGTRKPMVEEFKKASTDTTTAKKVKLGIPDEAKDAIWSPFNAEPSFTQKLMNCSKWASLFAALYILFYYWECTGQMQPSASVPAMTVCACMVGWSFGKYAFRGNR
jgi:hypothetical protein